MRSLRNWQSEDRRHLDSSTAVKRAAHRRPTRRSRAYGARRRLPKAYAARAAPTAREASGLSAYLTVAGGCLDVTASYPRAR